MDKTSDETKKFVYEGIYTSVFHHLWFLWYLLWLVAGFVIVVLLVKLTRCPQVSSKLFSPWLMWPLLLGVTFFMQLNMGDTLGPDTSTGYIPNPTIFLYYTIFFGFGALCYGRVEFETKIGKHWILLLITGAFVLPFVFYFKESNNLYQQMFAKFLSVLFCWLIVFGSIGLFRRFFSKKSKGMRYMSDSSYWLYIAHMPVIQLSQSLISGVDLPSAIKLTIVCAATVIALLIIYELFIRYTIIGTLLNGKKIKEVKPDIAVTT